jgi:hypothetical protein
MLAMEDEEHEATTQSLCELETYGMDLKQPEEKIAGNKHAPAPRAGLPVPLRIDCAAQDCLRRSALPAPLSIACAAQDCLRSAMRYHCQREEVFA